jgi:hypothetical protein
VIIAGPEPALVVKAKPNTNPVTEITTKTHAVDRINHETAPSPTSNNGNTSKLYYNEPKLELIPEPKTTETFPTENIIIINYYQDAKDAQINQPFATVTIEPESIMPAVLSNPITNKTVPTVPVAEQAMKITRVSSSQPEILSVQPENIKVQVETIIETPAMNESLIEIIPPATETATEPEISTAAPMALTEIFLNEDSEGEFDLAIISTDKINARPIVQREVDINFVPVSAPGDTVINWKNDNDDATVPAWEFYRSHKTSRRSNARNVIKLARLVGQISLIWSARLFA